MTVLSNNPDANSTLGNNTVNVTVPVTAVADISVSVEVRPDRVSCFLAVLLRNIPSGQGGASGAFALDGDPVPGIAPGGQIPVTNCQIQKSDFINSVYNGHVW